VENTPSLKEHSRTEGGGGVLKARLRPNTLAKSRRRMVDVCKYFRKPSKIIFNTAAHKAAVR
jgi:hypothetical protein